MTTLPQVNHIPVYKYARMAFCIAFVVLASFLLQDLQWFAAHQALGPDSGYYLMKSLQTENGAVPLRDFEAMHPPGIFYLQSFYFRLFGYSVEAIRGLLLVHYLGLAVFLALFLRLMCNLSVALIGLFLLVFLYTLPIYESFLYVIEPFCAFWGWAGLVTIAIILRLKSPSSQAQIGLGLLAGICISVALSIKQIGILFVAAGILVLLSAGREHRFAASAVFVGSLSLPTLFFALFPDTFLPWWNQNIIQLLSYASGNLAPEPIGGTFPGAIQVVRHYWIPLFLILPCILCIGALRTRGHLDQGTYLEVLGAFVVSCLGLLFLLPCFLRPYLHYYLFCLPCAAAGIAVAVRFCALHSSRYASLVLFLAGVGVYDCVTTIRPREPEEVRAWTRELEQQEKTLQFIKSVAGKSSEALIIPDSPQYYYLGNYQSPFPDYHYFPSPQYFTLAGKGEVPVIVIDRGHPRMAEYRARLRENGLILIEKVGSAEHWALRNKSTDTKK